MVRSCPGSKIRSQGKGCGLGTGNKRGPIGTPGGKNRSGNRLRNGLNSRRRIRRGIVSS